MVLTLVSGSFGFADTFGGYDSFHALSLSITLIHLVILILSITLIHSIIVILSTSAIYSTYNGTLPHPDSFFCNGTLQALDSLY